MFILPGKIEFPIEQKSYHIEQKSIFYRAKIHFLSSNQFAPLKKYGIKIQNLLCSRESKFYLYFNQNMKKQPSNYKTLKKKYQNELK